MAESTDADMAGEAKAVDQPTSSDLSALAKQVASLSVQVSKLAAVEEEQGTGDWLTRVKTWMEVALIPAALVAGVLTMLEYCNNAERERREVAEGAYDRADTNYNEFLKVCLEHVDLDCYSNRPFPPSAVSPQAKEESEEVRSTKQRVMFTMLVDTFEVAFVNYNNARYARHARAAYCTQWPTWVAAIRKYFRKSAFTDTWKDVGDEFDTKFQACMNALMNESPPRKTTARPLPTECMLFACKE